MELDLIMLFYHINMFDVFDLLSQWLQTWLGGFPMDILQDKWWKEYVTSIRQMETWLSPLTDFIPPYFVFVILAPHRKLSKVLYIFQTQVLFIKHRDRQFKHDAKVGDCIYF